MQVKNVLLLFYLKTLVGDMELSEELIRGNIYKISISNEISNYHKDGQNVSTINGHGHWT